MARRRKPEPDVDSKPRTEVGGTSLIGEQILNQQHLNLINHYQITLFSIIATFSLLAFFLTILGTFNIPYTF
jgi:hypothetical protein